MASVDVSLFAFRLIWTLFPSISMGKNVPITLNSP